MTFDDIARASAEKSTVESVRAVHLIIPKESQHLIRKLKGFENYDLNIHILRLLKGGYGLKDAPRLWRKRLHESLVSFGMKATQMDPSIYCKWRRQGENYELVLILSTHVDDLKGGGVPGESTGLLAHLEKEFGKGKLHWNPFEHCGIDYQQSDDNSSICSWSK